jgi:tRNA dimethylallyltransferase
MTGRIWLIAGPTASGKSALALRLAEAVGGEIVNADSMQLYRDLAILSARPGAEEMARAPHHLFGTLDAADGWSVGRWLRAATDKLVGIAGDAIVVGGTGLYFKALTEGLAEVPAVPAGVRAATAIEFETLGEAAFRARLAQIDPAAAARIAPGDRQRLARAWEVHAATGVALSDHQTAASGALPAGRWTALALEPPRPALYARCDARLEAMAADGAADEVRALLARGLDPALPAMKAVGVREFAACLAGETSLEEALATAQRETRRYAKRQMTWMRGQMAHWPRIDAADADAQWAQLLALHPTLTA